MKYLRLLSFALVTFLLVCTPPVSESPTVTATAVDFGFTLRLSWTAVSGATSYYIYYDGHTTKDTSTAGTSIDIKTPHKKIEVSAFNSAGESDKTLVDCAPKVTTTLTVYGMSNASYLNSIGFNASDGVCSVINDSNPANFSSMDYVFEDRSPAPQMSLYSPNEFGTPFNSKLDYSAASGTDFDALDSAKVTGNNTKTAINANYVYSLWMGTSTAWTTSDHFGKLKVNTVSGSTVTLSSVAYQKIGGLRWLVTK